jgi:hypothetical protein
MTLVMTSATDIGPDDRHPVDPSTAGYIRPLFISFPVHETTSTTGCRSCGAHLDEFRFIFLHGIRVRPIVSQDRVKENSV